ncbi:MAG: hypothetical protein ACQEQY_08730 [Halobacteriota archaeon]
MSTPNVGSTSRNRKQAALLVTPFLLLGVADVVLLLVWGIDPLWGFVILPPILFMTLLGWIAFTNDFDDR